MRLSASRKILLLLLAVFVLQVSGCCNRKTPEIPGETRKNEAKTAPEDVKKKPGAAETARPSQLLEKTGLNYSIDARSAANKKTAEKPSGSFFEKQYLEGVAMMENGEFSKAISVFDELIKRYPDSEEASIAELCIAELHFRSKANDLALKAFERIVEKYPNSHAAENARSGIDYLQNIERYETEFIAPDVESRKRRGY